MKHKKIYENKIDLLKYTMSVLNQSTYAVGMLKNLSHQARLKLWYITYKPWNQKERSLSRLITVASLVRNDTSDQQQIEMV